MRTLQFWLDRADELATAGRYFDAHEELEAPWKEASGDEKIALQGLIQLAAGLHRLRLDPTNPDGAFYLLERGLEKLRRGRELVTPESLAALEFSLNKIRTSGKAPEALRFGLRAETKREPFPEKYIFDDSDLPADSGWNMRRILDAIESGRTPEDFRRFFDRDPERRTPTEPGLIVSPADGLLELRRRPGKDPEFVIHLRLTDVHVQRVPLAGVVRDVLNSGSGYFYPDQEGYWGGVQTATTVDSALGCYVVRQITTLLTRRIESYLKPGQKVATGERLGRIRLGSTVVLELPGRWTAEAADGQKVVGGETVLARPV